MAQSRWYPSEQQLKDPVSLEKAFRQLLQMHYTLQDKMATMHDNSHKAHEGNGNGGSSPSNSMLLGLRVSPVDPETLADGATLKFNKKNGTFSFV